MGGVEFFLAAVTLVAVAGASHHLSQEDATATAVSVQGGACSRIDAASGVWPARPPDAEMTLALAAGENVTVVQGPGLWRAKLETDGARISPLLPMRNATPNDWTRDYDLMWCHTRPEAKTFLAESDGVLHVRAWQGAGDGFSAR